MINDARHSKYQKKDNCHLFLRFYSGSIKFSETFGINISYVNGALFTLVTLVFKLFEFISLFELCGGGIPQHDRFFSIDNVLFYTVLSELFYISFYCTLFSRQKIRSHSRSSRTLNVMSGGESRELLLI